MDNELKFGVGMAQAEDIVSPLPLQGTAVNAAITGAVANVTVRQTFGNPFNTPITLTYLFPLPERAAVVDYTITIGERVIQAEVKEREAARRTYEQAVAQGKRASLLEQQQPNLFTVEVGNVQPGEAIITQLVYEDRLRYSNGRYAFVFPMGITPKYHDPATAPANAEKLDRPFESHGTPVADATLNITVDAGVAVSGAASRTHTDTEIEEGETTLTAALTTIPNKDFELSWAVTAASVQAANWSSTDEDGETHLVTLLPPPLDITADPAPREFVFVVDRSGSMSGAPIQQAVNALRACIRALTVEDTFTIQAFDTQLEWFSQRTQGVTQANVDAADRWLDGVGARGGTDILGALKEALSLKADRTRQRYVVFLTDGAVSNDDRVLSQLAKKRGNARIFTFGIGSSVNRYLLSKLAEMGQGVAEFLGNNDDIEGALTRFQDRVSYPALTDVTLTFEGGSAWDTYPEVLPDLYIGQPLDVTTRFVRQGAAKVTTTGKRDGETVTLTMELPRPTVENATIRRLWARERLEHLMDSGIRGEDQEKIRAQIITLGLTHRMMTRYTSFVAVDSEQIEDAEDATEVRVSGALPEGLDADAFRDPTMTGGMVLRSLSPAPMPPVSQSIHDTGALNEERARGITMPPASPKKRAKNNRMMDWLESLAKKQSASSSPEPMTGATRPEYSVPIEELGLDEKTANSLKRTGITTVGDVQNMLERGGDSMLAIRNFGEDAFKEVRSKLKRAGYDAGKPLFNFTTTEDRLRWLARTQNVDGSWDADIERTAAALLAFARAGHTARVGDYRPALRKAYKWLVAADVSAADEVIGYAVARALAEHDGAPVAPPSFSGSVDDAEDITTLADLRRYALMHGAAQAPSELADDVLVQTWLAVGETRL